MGKKQNSRTGIKDAFKPVHILSQLAGLAPYNFVINPCNRVETIDISWKTNFASFMWSLVMLSTQAVGFVYVLSSNFIQNPNSLPELVAKTLQFPLINATGLTALALSLSTNRKKMLMIVEKLSIADKCIFKKDHTVYKKHNRVFTIVLVISAIYHIALHSVDTCFHPSSHINYYYSVSMCFCDFVWTINDLRYVNAVEIIAQNLVAMNKQLDAISDTQSHGSPSSDRHTRPDVFSSFTIANERHTQDVLDPINLDRNNSFLTSISDVISRISARILDLRVCYNELYHICHLVNSMYGFTLLMGFTAYTVCIISDIYSTYCMLATTYTEHEPISTSKITITILWTVSRVFKTFCVVFVSDRAESEHKKAVHKIQKLILYVGVSADVREQLDLFSIQLANNKIEFTACGVFSVNFQLVRSLLYTVVTYVIVLVQITWFKY
jgi:gustatory receptor